MRKFIVFATVALMPFWANAQELKFGYTNAEAIMYQLPEISGVESQMAEYNAKNKQLLQNMQVEIQNDQEVLEKMLADATKTKSEKDAQQAKLESGYQRYQIFLQQTQEDAQTQLKQLLKPLYDMVIRAIDSVAKKNNLFMVLEEGTIYYKTDKTIDITPLVKKELGIK